MELSFHAATTSLLVSRDVNDTQSTVPQLLFSNIRLRYRVWTNRMAESSLLVFRCLHNH